MNQQYLREQLIDTMQAMCRANLNRGSAGNLSVRVPQGFLVTPTGMACDQMKPPDIVLVDMAGRAQGTRQPSSEWRFHRDVYVNRPEAGAVLHAHAPFATALACLRRDIPPFHYMIARFGGSTVRCAEYATFGTQALSDAALVALVGRNACLLANHGLLVFGSDLRHALDMAIELEALCEQYWRACQIGPPVLLSGHEMAVVLEKFASYGQQHIAATGPQT
ncbi:MAG: class II aldolase/adducin family protein [Rhodocyclaceae bacterium]|nr:class II aldolase/adducin family protein [Rhodocyclaceae bacterium]